MANTQGHRQKRFTSRRKGQTGGKTFTPASVRLLLKNRLYLGEITHKGEVFDGQHDPIVEPRLPHSGSFGGSDGHLIASNWPF